MSINKDFMIKDGILKKYKGAGGAVVVPEGVTVIDAFAFEGCETLTRVVIPDGVKEIRDRAFQGCSILTSVSIPASVENLTSEVFEYCPGLVDENKFMIISNRLIQYSGRRSKVIIPDGVTEISCGAFYGNSTLTSVVIPDSVTTINHTAFYRCTKLSNISIPDSVTRIGNGAFSECSSLATVSIPDSVTRIGNGAFSGCSSLVAVCIPDSVAELGKKVFEDCANLTSILISDPSRLDAKNRCVAAVAFANQRASSNDPRYAVYCKLIKANAQKWLDTAVVTPSLMGLMCREKLIPAKLVPEYMEAAQTAGNTECIAMLLEYNANKLTTGEKSRAAKKKETDADTVVDRKILRAEKKDIEGLVFVVTGDLLTFKNRNELKAFITEKGGKMASSMTAKVDYLIMNDTSSDTEKKKKAEELGIDIITEQQFNDKVGRLFLIQDNGLLTKYIGTGKEVVIPEGVTQIGRFAFSKCAFITAVSIPKSVTAIHEYAFCECGALTEISIPDSVTEIGKSAFSRCESLNSISIPDTITMIPDQAFWGCSSLVDVSIPETVTQIGYGAFYGCKSLVKLIIPCTVTEIGSSAFSDCTSLTAISIPNSVRKLDHSVFWGCDALAQVSIHASISEISEYTFFKCTALTKISIPASAETIGRNAFAHCASLAEIHIPDSVNEIFDNSFDECPTLTIHAPAGSYAETYAKENNIPFVAE